MSREAKTAGGDPRFERSAAHLGPILPATLPDS